MKSHVNLLGIFQLAWGGMGLLLSVSLLLLGVGAGAIARTAQADRFTPTLTALIFFVFAVALALGGCLNAWAGRALREHRAAGRTGVFALSVVNLFVLPFGTALAIYTYWVLLHNEARALFDHGSSTH